MGDAEYVTKVECLTQHRQMDEKINGEVEAIRREVKSDIEKVYAKIDRLFYAGVGLIITSMISIGLTLFSLMMSGRP